MNEPARTITDTEDLAVSIIEHMGTVCRDPATGVVNVRGEGMVDALVDALALTLAPAPYCATLRGRKETVETIAKSLKDRIGQLVEVKSATAGGSSLLPGLGGPPAGRA